MRRSLIMKATAAGHAATTLADASTAQAATDDPFYGKLWGLQQIHAEQAWAQTTAVGSVVAAVDTGIDYTLADLAGQILPGATFTGCTGAGPRGNGDFRGPGGVNNGDEHGTHVVGTIAAVRGNGIGVVGVAPGAKILPVKVLEAGWGSSESIASGIRWANDHGADVVNLSLGSIPGGQLLSIAGVDTAMKDAIAYARSKGVVTVAAAGNSSTALCNDPAFDSEAICIGATDKRGLHSWYSELPNKLDQKLVSAREGWACPHSALRGTAMRTSGRRCPRARGLPAVARRTTTRTPERRWRHCMSRAWRRCCSPRAAPLTAWSRPS